MKYLFLMAICLIFSSCRTGGCDGSCGRMLQQLREKERIRKEKSIEKVEEVDSKKEEEDSNYGMSSDPLGLQGISDVGGLQSLWNY